MRELKFRVWDNLYKTWLTKKVYHANITVNDLGIGEFTFKQHPQGFTIQQFTGLLDSEGKEIYEGDIIELKGYCPLLPDPKIHEIFKVEWLEDRCGFNIAKYSDANHKIIGNTMQNPELLKQ